MNYNFNGKTIKISDEDIEKSMKCLDISKEEAIQMWLEDEGYLENEEQEALEQKAKENRITATIHEAKSTKTRKKTQKERVQKEDPVKESLIAGLADWLNTIGVVSDIEVVNKTKVVTFAYNGEKFKFDLIRTRVKKAEKTET